MLEWLRPGRDHQLAREQYADRESATDRARRKDAEARVRRTQRHHRRAADPDAFDGNGFTRRRRGA
ncbi:hypothetical protein ACFY0R_39715 [Streptomyces sp. NPDC001633]|uniref:hypothetical protein n=1 Tax=Streptomyces sp. NPDC001633 TaxID=3364595 RepID=UPI0036A54F23